MLEFKIWLEEVAEQPKTLRYFRSLLNLPFGFVRRDDAYKLLNAAYSQKHGIPEAKEAYQALHQELDRVHGRHFDDFFTKVTSGDETYKTNVAFTPELDMAQHESWVNARNQYDGNFDLHIKTSIPTFRELQDKKGHAIVQAFGKYDLKMLDIGGSEGSFARTISHMTNGKIETDILDPNQAMKNLYDMKGKTPGSKYLMAAFLHGWMQSDGSQMPAISADNHRDRYDIVNESMAFQFMNNNRGTHIREAKRLMAPNGLFLTEEKLHAADKETWDKNEKFKDQHYKNRYYPQDKLDAKNKVVAFSGEKKVDSGQDEEAAVVGMANNMVSVNDFEKVLLQNFQNVWQYWDSGNFKGYAASDSSKMTNDFIRALGPVTSKYSTTNLPRKVDGQKQEQYMAFSEWANKISDKKGLRKVIIDVLPSDWDHLTDQEIKDKLGMAIIKALVASGHEATVDNLDDILDFMDDWAFQKEFDRSDYDSLC